MVSGLFALSRIWTFFLNTVPPTWIHRFPFRLARAGHEARMYDTLISKKILTEEFHWTRKVKLNVRWMKAVTEDARTQLGACNWTDRRRPGLRDEFLQEKLNLMTAGSFG